MLLALLSLTAANAQEGVTEDTVFVPRPVASRPVFDMRVGVDSSARAAMPYICAEGYPLSRVSLEACGTGAGVLHQGPAAEMAHFRGRFTALEHETGRLQGGLLLGAGVAEVQSGADAPGFRFGEAQSDDQVEAAGAELSASLKGRIWVDERAYIVADLNAGAAFIPAAPTVMGAEGPVLAFGALTLGLGF